MLSSVTLDNAAGVAVVLHETTKRALVTAHGLAGVGAFRQSKRVRPTAHGGINETHWEDGKSIVLEGEVMSQVSIEDAFTEFHAVTFPMVQTMDIAPALLKWTEGVSGLSLQRLVKLDSEIDPPIQEAAAVLNWQAQFFAEDPRAYSQTLSTVVSSPLSTSAAGVVLPAPFNWLFGAASGGVAACTNAGNRPTPPVLRLLGGWTNPVVTKLSNGATASLIGTIGTGDYVELDIAKRTVKLNGSTNAQYLLDSAHTDWGSLEVPAQSSETYTLRAQSNDANAALTVFYRAAYA